MRLDELKELLLAEDSKKVYKAIDYMENNPEHEFSEIIIEKIKKEKNIFIIIKILDIVPKINSSSLFKDVYQALKNTKEEYILATLIVMLSKSGDNYFEDFILNCLQHKDQRVKANAIESIERLRVKKAIPKLVSLIKSSNARVKINAAKCLYSFGDTRMIKVFEKLLYSDDVYNVESVIFVLGSINTYDSYRLLTDFFKSTKNIRLQLVLLDLFCRIGREDIIPDIRKLTISYDSKLSESAEYCIKKINNRIKSKKVCKKCNEEFPESQKFCGNCGEKL